MKTRIVLLGSGYTSVWTYKYLWRHAKKAIKMGQLEIVVLSNTDFHAFHGFTGEFLSGYLPLKFRKAPIAEIMPFAHHVQGVATQVIAHKNTVSYFCPRDQVQKQMRYDHLVVGIGSANKTSGVKGIQKHGLGVKAEGGLDACRRKIIRAVQRAERAKTAEERELYLNFCVAGSGFAAVEIATNLCEYLENLKPIFPVLSTEGYRLHLIHGSETLLPQLKAKFKRMRRYTEKILNQYDIEVHYGVRLSEITPTSVQLENEETIRTTVAICALGETAEKLNAEFPLSKLGTSRIQTKHTLQVKGFSNIWAGGDVAEVEQPFKLRTCRADALWAIKHGTHIGKNLARMNRKKAPKKFWYPGLGQTAGFGKNKAILELYGIQFTGWMAWISRIGFFLYFMPSKKQALSSLKAMMRFEKDLIPEGPRLAGSPLDLASSQVNQDSAYYAQYEKANEEWG